MKRTAAIGAAILVIFAGLVAGGLMITHSKPPVKPAPAVTQQTQTAPTVQELWQATNQERQKAGLQPLVLDERLNASAQAKCGDEGKYQYFAHNSPAGKTPFDFITAQGIQYDTAGENLSQGYDNTKELMAAWMASPGHRANILNDTYQNVGFAICKSNGRVMVVQHFIKPYSGADAQPTQQ